MVRGKSVLLVFSVIAGMLVFAPAAAGAEEGTPRETGVAASTELGVQISTMPELKLLAAQSFTLPFLRGSGPLSAGNNLKAAFTVELSPVSINGRGELTWTPIAFLQAVAGGMAGSGWNIDLLGMNIYGIGINEPVGEPAGEPRQTEVRGSAFDGVVWRLWGGVALQFDLAALVPGDWNHILFRAYNEGRYGAYSRARGEESWIFENDAGENRNGWSWYASYVIGYQMPRSPVLDTIAFMAEMEKNLYNTPGGDRWGEGLTRWIFSSLFNFRITPRFSATVAVQMRTLRNYGYSDLENENRVWYQDLELSGDNGKRRLLFYRAAAVLTYKLR
ncbi:MAG: hypothetical protein LBC62_03745 [Treponema sp.]|jgi:hypothetical protein|nr:hypothetical protein [Treponema sp.]